MIQIFSLYWAFRKGSGISLSHFLYGFSRGMFLKLYSMNWSNFIVGLPLLLEILGNIWSIMCNIFPRLWRHKFGIKFIFLIKPFFYMTQKSKQKIKSLKKRFLRWNKKHFSSFLRPSVAKSCLRPESVPLKTATLAYAKILVKTRCSSQNCEISSCKLGHCWIKCSFSLSCLPLSRVSTRIAKHLPVPSLWTITYNLHNAICLKMVFSEAFVMRVNVSVRIFNLFVILFLVTFSFFFVILLPWMEWIPILKKLVLWCNPKAIEKLINTRLTESHVIVWLLCLFFLLLLLFFSGCRWRITTTSCCSTYRQSHM